MNVPIRTVLAMINRTINENIVVLIKFFSTFFQGRMTLIIAKIRHSDFGDYHCIARNDLAITRGLVSVYGESVQLSCHMLKRLYAEIYFSELLLRMD